ncbi:hypothetical protein SBI_00358 [Streptomyces bingchenggensis BCW-1]|uniref:Uncharacterized protein n=1 Tax=Streptomyces bingchenggensis (strain BCW-1) TaxID=749414 RepID=D7BYF1_STRBB|nr:hypothetical protein SBI_00358 [Streptomyces bingchenggensis BCW-1]
MGPRGEVVWLCTQPLEPAATTSLPERAGARRDDDHRFAWSAQMPETAARLGIRR